MISRKHAVLFKAFKGIKSMHAAKKLAKTVILTIVLLNKLRCHAYFKFSANQITLIRVVAINSHT